MDSISKSASPKSKHKKKLFINTSKSVEPKSHKNLSKLKTKFSEDQNNMMTTGLNLDKTELLLRTYDPYSPEENALLRSSEYSDSIGNTNILSDPFGEPQFLTGISGHQEIFALPRDELIIQNFMKLHTCYDLIPTSGKMVIFDTSLSVKKAFFALVYNGVRAAPLWDSQAQSFVGMLTITDFINVLRILRNREMEGGITLSSENLEEHKIQTWRDELLKQHRRPFLWVDPRVNLLRAARLLAKNRVHRLPVVDPVTGNALYILTHKRILRFLCLYIDDLLARPRFMDKSLDELNIGTFKDVQTVYEDTPLYIALDKFAEKRVSALPIISRDGTERVIDIYAKFDVINLAAERSYRNLDVTVKQALSYRSHVIESVHSCQKWEKLGAVVDRIVKAGVHRLVVVDESWKCVGMLSLSDILCFLIKPSTISSTETK